MGLYRIFETETGNLFLLILEKNNKLYGKILNLVSYFGEILQFWTNFRNFQKFWEELSNYGEKLKFWRNFQILINVQIFDKFSNFGVKFGWKNY